jgi:hypothetical protein
MRLMMALSFGLAFFSGFPAKAQPAVDPDVKCISDYALANYKNYAVPIDVLAGKIGEACLAKSVNFPAPCPPNNGRCNAYRPTDIAKRLEIFTETAQVFLKRYRSTATTLVEPPSH